MSSCQDKVAELDVMPVLSTIFLLATAAKNSTTTREDGGVTVNETLVNKIWLNSEWKNLLNSILLSKHYGTFFWTFRIPEKFQKLKRILIFCDSI